MHPLVQEVASRPDLVNRSDGFGMGIEHDADTGVYTFRMKAPTVPDVVVRVDNEQTAIYLASAFTVGVATGVQKERNSAKMREAVSEHRNIVRDSTPIEEVRKIFRNLFNEHKGK